MYQCISMYSIYKIIYVFLHAHSNEGRCGIATMNSACQSKPYIIYIYMYIYRYVCTGQNVPNVISMDYNVYYVAGIYVNDDFEIMFITRNILIFYSYSHVSCHVPWYIHKCVCVYIIMNIQIYIYIKNRIICMKIVMHMFVAHKLWQNGGFVRG